MIERTPEPELMNDEAQARAYSDADFSVPHDMFIDTFKAAHPNYHGQDQVLDLGCGPADVTCRFAKAYPTTQIDACDAAEAMLALAKQRVSDQQLSQRIQFFHTYLPALTGLKTHYSTIISNSLLHHLAEPMVLWNTIKNLATSGTRIFIMDLRRPTSRAAAIDLCERYAINEPAVLQHDFFHSLLAAYCPDEVHEQLEQADMKHLNVMTPTDRHLIIHGKID